MKVLYIDFNTIGHHSVYYNAISSIQSIDSVIVLPRHKKEDGVKQYIIPDLSRNMNLFQYLRVIKEINRIICVEKPSFVHILSGDMLYRFMGVGLNRINAPTIVTFHHMEFSIPRKISYKLIFNKIHIGIIHTEYIYNKLTALGIPNVYHIEYPYLEELKVYDTQKLKEEFRIPMDRKVLLAFGETRYDKGLDILLAALSHISDTFHLIVAGKPTEITKDRIECLISNYRDNTTLLLSFIDDETMCKLFNICDIVVLPYRRKFAGASGPLTTAVAYGKMVIGPNANSIGDIIHNNHLGSVFECEDQQSLKKCISDSLHYKFVYDDKAKNYKDKISKSAFLDCYRNIYFDKIS